MLKFFLGRSSLRAVVVLSCSMLLLQFNTYKQLLRDAAKNIEHDLDDSPPLPEKVSLRRETREMATWRNITPLHAVETNGTEEPKDPEPLLELANKQEADSDGDESSQRWLTKTDEHCIT